MDMHPTVSIMNILLTICFHWTCTTRSLSLRVSPSSSQIIANINVSTLLDHLNVIGSLNVLPPSIYQSKHSVPTTCFLP